MIPTVVASEVCSGFVELVKDKGIKLAVRINLSKPNILKDSNKLPGGESVEYKLFSIPFYLT